MITIPTLSQLISDIRNDLESKFGDSIPLVGKIFLNALAAVQGGKLKLYYLVIGSLQKNIFVDTADPEATGGTLERFGRVKLGRNPFPATAGSYVVSVTGEVGSVILGGTTFRSNDDSTNPEKLFQLDSNFELLTSPDEITVRALEAGLDSQMFADEEMTATIPIAGVDRTATVVSESITPLAAEDLEDYREKAMNAFRTEPNGGAASDYRIWAADAQGVAQVYPYAKSGYSGEINLYIEATLIDSVDGMGTPTAAIINAVEDVVEFDPDTTKPLNERGRRPLGVFQINFLPVVIKQVTINIAGYVGGTTEIQNLIKATLVEVISEIRPFVAGADILADKNDILDTNKIIAAIFVAKPGSVFGVITLNINASPVSSYTFTSGDIPFIEESDITFL